jgi:hypothetical protein
MSPRIRQYIFGSLFFAFGMYYMIKKDYVEGSLYCLAGLSFIFNTLVAEPSLLPYKKVLVIVTWGLIIITAILFLWVLQFKYF